MCLIPALVWVCYVLYIHTHPYRYILASHIPSIYTSTYVCGIYVHVYMCYTYPSSLQAWNARVATVLRPCCGRVAIHTVSPLIANVEYFAAGLPGGAACSEETTRQQNDSNMMAILERHTSSFLLERHIHLCLLHVQVKISDKISDK